MAKRRNMRLKLSHFVEYRIRFKFIILTILIVTFSLFALASGENLTKQHIPKVSLTSSVGSWTTQLVPTGGTMFDDATCVQSVKCWIVSTPYPSGSSDFISSTSNGTSWTTSNLPVGLNPVQISCANSSDCWIIGSGIYYSQDGGSTWSSESEPVGLASGSSLISIFCISSTTCWLITTSYDSSSNSSYDSLYQTTDSGSSWTQLQIPTSYSSFGVQINCVSTNMCWLYGVDNGYVYQSTDGGTSWSQVSIASGFSLSGFSCVGTSFCVATGSQASVGTVYVTADGGSSWTNSTISSANYLNTVTCISVTECWVMGTQTTPPLERIYTTADGGSSWTEQQPPSQDSQLDLTPTSISCMSANVCVGVGLGAGGCGGYGPCGGGQSFVMVTADGGSTWSEDFNNILSPMQDIENISTIDCTSASNCIAIGEVGGPTSPTVELSTQDGGSTWTLSEPFGSASYYIDGHLQCPSSQVCLVPATQFNGSTSVLEILITTDGGSSWTSQALPSVGVTGYQEITGTSCYGISLCVFSGYSSTSSSTFNPEGFIIYTTSAGSSWALATIPSGLSYVNGVSCISNVTCIATASVTSSSSGQELLISNDGGSQWQVMSAITSSLEGGGQAAGNGFSCISQYQCISVANGLGPEPRESYATINGGSSWQASQVTSSVVGDFQCVESAYCVAVGGALSGSYNGGTIFTTNNFGTTWTENTLPAGVLDLYNISCFGAGNCYAVGQNGVIVAEHSVPVITSLSPASGVTYGGNGIDIFGYGFLNATAVDFGANPASSFEVVSDGEITAVSPAGSGTVNITVTTPNGVSATGLSNEFEYIAPTNYYPISPTRICDTRPVDAPYVLSNECNTPNAMTLNSGGILNIPVVGQANVPTDAVAVVVNVTVTDTNANGGFLTVYPGGEQSPPNSSNLNWSAGQTVANMVTVPIGTNGAIQAYNYVGTADVIVDVEGYYAPASTSSPNAGGYVPIVPFRVCDTRQVQSGVLQNQCNNSTSNSPIAPNGVINIQITGENTIPTSGVSAIAINITAISPTTPGGGYLTAYPQGGSKPNVSNVNFTSYQTVPNRAIVELSTSGQISIYNFNGYTNIAVDVVGYYTSSSSTTSGSLFVPMSPVRICDTRTAQGINVSSNECNTPTAETLGSNGTLAVQATGVDSVPSGITALVANVTVTDTDANGGYLTVYPGGTVPNISDLNWTSGATVANQCLITVSSNGSFSVYNFAGSADIIVDVSGYFLNVSLV